MSRPRRPRGAGPDRLPRRRLQPALVILSHGLGGSREGIVAIGQYWANHGYVAVYLQHAGSDESLWRGVAPMDVSKNLHAGMGPEQLVAREDVKLALDELARRDADLKWPLHGRLDLARVAMAGHSFGALIAGDVRRALTQRQHVVRPATQGRHRLQPLPPAGDPRQAFATLVTAGPSARSRHRCPHSAANASTCSAKRCAPNATVF